MTYPVPWRCLAVASITKIVTCAALAISLSTPRTLANNLPTLGADLRQTSVSGLSSGSYMAAQFQIAHGDIVVGAGLIAGGPYGCAESAVFPRLSVALFGCMKTHLSWFGLPDPAKLADAARARAKRGDIAPVSTVATDRVFLFSGRQDKTVATAVVRAASAFYAELGVSETGIQLVTNVDAGHAFATRNRGNACRTSETPYIVDCDLDLAGALLQHIYGQLKPPAERRPTGRIVRFQQAAYAGRAVGHSLHDTGLAFIPAACDSATGCRVHVAFHGCEQTLDDIGDVFVTDTGYLRWAATNRMIVLYPQIAKSWSNPKGCWDWWGYTGPEYLSRRAAQIAAVRRMLARLAKPPPAASGGR
ncbi:MAG: poly(3-hydroxybutyrate) depolymerase [Pseudomonadota bacterium]